MCSCVSSFMHIAVCNLQLCKESSDAHMHGSEWNWTESERLLLFIEGAGLRLLEWKLFLQNAGLYWKQTRPDTWMNEWMMEWIDVCACVPHIIGGEVVVVGHLELGDVVPRGETWGFFYKAVLREINISNKFNMLHTAGLADSSFHLTGEKTEKGNTPINVEVDWLVFHRRKIKIINTDLPSCRLPR